MTAFQRLLAFLASVLGDDNEHVLALQDATPADVEALELSDDHGLTDDQIDILAGLHDVDGETIEAVASALIEAAQTAETATLHDIADNLDGLRWVQDIRTEASEAEELDRQAVLNRINPTQTDEERALAELEALSDEDRQAVVDYAEAVASDAPPADPPEGEDAPEAPTEEMEPVTAAARPRIGKVAARRTKGGLALAKVIEDRTAQQAQWELLDQIGTTPLGAMLDDSDMVEAFGQRIDQIGRSSGRGSGEGVPMTFAQLTREFDEDRDLTRMSKDEAGEYLDRYVREAQMGLMSASDPIAALTASGGLCTPRVPLYDIPTLAGMDRPVRDFLPNFRAERGGITFRPGRSISTLGAIDSANSGIAVQTIARDEQGVNKPIYRVPCPATENADVYAIPARLIHGNFLERFDPEAVQTAVTLQGALHARVAETELLNRIDAASDDVQTQAQNTATIGFARAYLVNVDALVTGIRSRERSGTTFVLDHLAPFWVLAAMRSDLALELPGSSDERLAVADSKIETFFSARNIRTGWFIDQQVMGNQVDEGNVVNYPGEVVSYVFEPGHHIALDGGQLTLGVYRDSALNQENDAETFMETFEGLAPRGVVSYALHSDTCITGATSAAVDVGCGLVS